MCATVAELYLFSPLKYIEFWAEPVKVMTRPTGLSRVFPTRQPGLVATFIPGLVGYCYKIPGWTCLGHFAAPGIQRYELELKYAISVLRGLS